MNVRLPRDLVARIDQNRGIVSRDSWIEKAAELALKPTSIYQEPELKPAVHEHRAVVPLRTEFVGGQKVKVYQCDCGREVRKT